MSRKRQFDKRLRTNASVQCLACQQRLGDIGPQQNGVGMGVKRGEARRGNIESKFGTGRHAPLDGAKLDAEAAPGAGLIRTSVRPLRCGSRAA